MAREKHAIPYPKVARMWDAGKTYEQIAKAIKRYSTKSEDPTKPVRAIISRMLNAGYDVDGKTVVLKVRDGMRNLGVGKKSKAKVKAKAKTKAVAKRTRKTAKPAVSSKPAVLVLTVKGKNVLIEAPKRKNIISLEKFLPMVSNELHKSGYAIVQEASHTAPASTEPLGDLEDANVDKGSQGSETPEGTEQEVSKSAA